MSQLRLTATMVVVLVASVAQAASVALPTTLDKLLPAGTTTTVGGLTFDGFSYSATGDMPVAALINVLPLPSGNGIRFQGAFLDLPGGPGNGASDGTIDFTVSGAGINSATLRGNPSLLGGTGSASVTETFKELPLQKLDIYDNLANGNLPFTTFSAVSFAPLSKLSVTKDILLLTSDPVRSATVSFMDQEFTPEPASLGLGLIGLAGLGLFRRRR